MVTGTLSAEPEAEAAAALEEDAAAEDAEAEADAESAADAEADEVVLFPELQPTSRVASIAIARRIANVFFISITPFNDFKELHEMCNGLQVQSGRSQTH